MPDDPDLPSWARRLRDRARELGLTDSEVARRTGLSQSRYANYTNGVREPDLATLVAVCRVLETTPYPILGVTAERGGGGPFAVERAEALRLVGALGQILLPLAVGILRALAAYGPPGPERSPSGGGAPRRRRPPEA
ncbi:helix-turn-helix domain-containing protein [Roseomonas sp. CCTCC AB2023176]|uniref:helix-turn-helix domain-containing protein n=1 Tax=Roseomonas sp. CCTCC AB2023176 TaxID=3342640 RepID=UPI0035DE07AB